MNRGLDWDREGSLICKQLSEPSRLLSSSRRTNYDLLVLCLRVTHNRQYQVSNGSLSYPRSTIETGVTAGSFFTQAYPSPVLSSSSQTSCNIPP